MPWRETLHERERPRRQRAAKVSRRQGGPVSACANEFGIARRVAEARLKRAEADAAQYGKSANGFR